MAINKRERNLLIVTITLVVLGLNYFLAQYLLEGWQQKGGDLVKKQKELGVVNNTIAHIPEWQQAYENLHKGLNKAAHFEAVSDVLKQIDDIGTVAGVAMQSKRTLKTEEHDVYREWPVRCDFEATTQSLVTFLVGLQSGSGFMTVEQLDVASKPDNSGILRCVIQIRALAAKGDRAAL